MYSLHLLLKIPDPSVASVRRNIELLEERHSKLRERIASLREALEKLGNPSEVDSFKVGQIRTLLVDSRTLDQSLDKTRQSVLDKLKLMSVRSVKTGSSIIEMDESTQEKFMMLSQQEDLLDEANAKIDKGLATGVAILSNLDAQKQKSRSILHSLGKIGKELNVSKWTAGMTVRRLQADKRLLVATFCCCVVVVILVKLILRHFRSAKV